MFGMQKNNLDDQRKFENSVGSSFECELNPYNVMSSHGNMDGSEKNIKIARRIKEG